MYDLNQFKSYKWFKNKFIWSYKPCELIGKMTHLFICLNKIIENPGFP